MLRKCTRCGRPFEKQDFVKDESKYLESERRAAGLQGVHLYDYLCPDCGTEDVFVDVVRQEGETDTGYQARKAALEAGVERVQGEAVEVVVVEKKPQAEGGRMA